MVWLTGISGAGKSTLAMALADQLRADGHATEVLDGDLVRDFFDHDLGYSREDRTRNVMRIAFAAKLLADHGVIAIVANIAPYREVRARVRAKLPAYTQVYVKVALATARARDVKGLYARHAAGAEQPLVGVDDGYDEPQHPDLVLDTDVLSVHDATERLIDVVRARVAA
ncbi:MAG: adenylyl-sulfate kinase [Gemmatimonadaceae bacterium]|nr:adenylyl-sulfate kinase [Gemmatimonadaceae bacterium]